MRHNISKHIALLGMGLCLSLTATAQEQTVRGQVVDELGEPVIGASVTLAGDKSKGTITDLDGNYQLSVPKDAKVTVTYIGYLPQTVKPGGVVKLAEDKQSLDEVVVVGYGSQKKAHLTGSVVTVPMDEIQDLASGSLASTLSGLVPGLSVSGGNARPGENARLQIRDVGALDDVGSSAQQPLFVIDGYIYPNDIKVGNSFQNLGAEAFNNLDPSEVESITVLKDASAAVYGSRAANGVILVTTKKGKVGAPSISYGGTFGFTDEVARPKMLSSWQYGRLYNAIAGADPTNTSLNHTTALFQADELEAMRGLDYDLLDKYWETGTKMKHSINVSGATDKVSYFAGGSYFDQEGNLGKLDYDRWNYRAGVDVKVSQWLSANLTVSGDYGKKNTPLLKVGGSNGEKDYNLLLTRPRYMPEYVDDYALVSYGVSNTQRNQNQNYAFDVLQNNGDFNRNMSSNTSINAGLNYDFGWSKVLKGLKIGFTYSKSINTTKTNQYGSNFTLYQMVNRYGSGSHLYTPTSGDRQDFDYLAESNFLPLSLNNGNMLYRTMTRNDNYQMNFTAQYARTFGQHDLSALFSIERSEQEAEYLQGEREQPYPFTTWQYNSATGELTTVFTRSESASFSYIGRLNYAFMNRYLLEFLFRADASTKFGPGHRWGYFPSVSGGWVVSEEEWFRNNNSLSWIDFLKLRASWGLTGRDNLAPWQWMQIYAQDANGGVIFGTGTGNDSSNRITINKNNSAVNSEAHWDKSYKMNVGLDFQVLRKRLAFTFEYYYEKNREMLMNLSQEVPGTVGTQSASINLGKMNNWGWELSVTWRDKIGKDLSYHVGVNTGMSDNKVLLMDWTTDPKEIYRSIQYGSRTDLGLWGMQCIGMFRSFQDIEEYFDTYMRQADGTYGTYMGLTKDKVRPGMLIYKDVRGAYNQETGTYDGPDGIVDRDNDQVQLGKRSNIYGFTVNMGGSWKGLGLTAQLGASWGGYMTLPSQALSVPSTSNIEFYNMPSFWDPDNVYVYQDVVDGRGYTTVPMNRDAYYPNPSYGINSIASSFWRVSAARVALNRLTLSYTVPSKTFKKIGIKSCRVNVTGQNLINFYNPYPDHFTSPMAGSYGAYPNLRSWTAGVNLSF
ncbi:MAG: TonB-dependent receptor [Prevotella sp.]|nr:TonB-dependent receptor [Prevotella sp.]